MKREILSPPCSYDLTSVRKNPLDYFCQSVF